MNVLLLTIVVIKATLRILGYQVGSLLVYIKRFMSIMTIRIDIILNRGVAIASIVNEDVTDIAITKFLA